MKTGSGTFINVRPITERQRKNILLNFIGKLTNFYKVLESYIIFLINTKGLFKADFDRKIDKEMFFRGNGGRGSPVPGNRVVCTQIVMVVFLGRFRVRRKSHYEGELIKVTVDRKR